MAVGNDKTRILVNIPIELKKQLEDKAKQENRSLSNYIVTVLIKELEKDQ
ncbi:DNA-binding protein [Velocimicrobium porci]|uniref:DNA-binding protein n=1 Tax=Velocimicrobium porci TaxID=2606634 RepID=A0A6L5XZ06_9FIRM|nr:DNA-binding protein [Velocimicrobium porci]MSS64116.1 DNA-binding protein [Velocimicrobium porci]